MGFAAQRATNPFNAKDPFSLYQMKRGSSSIEQETNNNNNNHSFDVDIDESLDSHDIEDAFEDSLIIEDRASLCAPKTTLNRIKQVSPINEEDEPSTDSSRADVTMTSASDELAGLVSFATMSSKAEPQMFTTRRSTSMDRFVSQPRNADNSTPVIFPSRHSLSGSSAFNCVHNKESSAFGRDARPSVAEVGQTTNYRPTSHDWLRRTFTLSTPKGYKSSSGPPSASGMRSASTQVPVYVTDKVVQTQTSGAPDRFTLFGGREGALPQRVHLRRGSQAAQSSARPEEKPFYVCYPNYSLPDLSFLDTTKPKVYTSPTKVTAPSFSRAKPVRRGPRPKSLNDFEALSKQGFKHIRDWDSLNVLLSDELKAIIMKAQQEEFERTSRKQSQMWDEGGERWAAGNNGVKMRYPRRRMSRENESSGCDGSMSSRGCGCSSNGSSASRAQAESKRFSLQEPFGAAHELSANGSQETENNKCMTRSETMPICHQMPAYHWPGPYAPCAYSCCHHHVSCCRPSSAARMAAPDSSIDQLCKLLSMDNTLQEVTELLNATTPLESPMTPRESMTGFADKNFRLLRQQWEELADSLGQKDSTSTICESSIASSMVPSGTSKVDAPSARASVASRNSICERRAKPEVPAKPSSVVMRPARTGARIARPVSLNTQSSFKSMIPVARGTRTPPGTKLNSPTVASTRDAFSAKQSNLHL